jgi:polyhydroxyalkanoate synthesis regulator phasin
MKKRVLAGAVAGVAVAGGGAALAANHFNSPQQESQAVVNDAAKQLGVQPGQLSAALKKALENRVDAAVAAGQITKAQGEELKKRIESGPLPLFGPPMGRPDHHGFGPFADLDVAASYLGLSEAQLRTKLDSGSSLAAVAKAQGKSVSGLVDALYADAKKHLDSAVAAGRLSKSQETRILADLKTRLTDVVNGEHPWFHEDHRGFDRPPLVPSDGPRL